MTPHAIADELAVATAPCVTSSFQAEDVVLVHMVRALRPDIPVLFLDTYHHFPALLEYRDRLVDAWRLNLVTLRAEHPAVGLWQTNTTDCCARHKVEPLFAALARYDMWFTGLRREQSPSRAGVVELDRFRLPGGKTIRKINPLARWSTKQVWDYAGAHGIPLLPLYEQGYMSVGCQPCTSIPSDSSNLRSGRWHGEKLECGIHLQPPNRNPF